MENRLKNTKNCERVTIAATCFQINVSRTFGELSSEQQLPNKQRSRCKIKNWAKRTHRTQFESKMIDWRKQKNGTNSHRLKSNLVLDKLHRLKKMLRSRAFAIACRPLLNGSSFFSSSLFCFVLFLATFAALSSFVVDGYNVEHKIHCKPKWISSVVSLSDRISSISHLSRESRRS